MGHQSPLGSLFQCLTTLTVKRCFPVPCLILPRCSCVPFLCVLSHRGAEPSMSLCVPSECCRAVRTSLPPPDRTTPVCLALLTGHAFQTFYQLFCCPLGCFTDHKYHLFIVEPRNATQYLGRGCTLNPSVCGRGLLHGQTFRVVQAAPCNTAFCKCTRCNKKERQL